MKKNNRPICEATDLTAGYREFDQKEINNFFNAVSKNEEINAIFNHFLDIYKEKNNEAKDLRVLTKKTLVRLTGEDVDKFEVIFGYYLVVIDYYIVYRGTPAYIHITRPTEDGGGWKCQVFRRGH